jgi:hypothetical protein
VILQESGGREHEGTKNRQRIQTAPRQGRLPRVGAEESLMEMVSLSSREWGNWDSQIYRSYIFQNYFCLEKVYLGLLTAE